MFGDIGDEKFLPTGDAGVTNAYIRHWTAPFDIPMGDMPKRAGWTPVEAVGLSEEVEDWND